MERAVRVDVCELPGSRGTWILVRFAIVDNLVIIITNAMDSQMRVIPWVSTTVPTIKIHPKEFPSFIDLLMLLMTIINKRVYCGFLSIGRD